MSDTSSVETARTLPAPSRWDRLRFRWHAEQEIHDLTRDREHEERVVAEATVRLQPGPWNIALLFRRDAESRR